MTLAAQHPEIQGRYQKDGYVVHPGLLQRGEAQDLLDHFMALRAQGPRPMDMGGDPRKGPADPLNLFPRFLHMQHWDPTTVRWVGDPRILGTCREILGSEPRLCQTMVYFKPSGARGQAVHQDCQYIRDVPVIGVWIALERADAENGRMEVYPGSHKLGLQKVRRADEGASFTNGEAEIPWAAGKAVGLDMEAGDALFFDGFLIHGSQPNRTRDRFRRSFQIHYFAAETRRLPDDPSTNMASLVAP